MSRDIGTAGRVLVTVFVGPGGKGAVQVTSRTGHYVQLDREEARRVAELLREWLRPGDEEEATALVSAISGASRS